LFVACGVGISELVPAGSLVRFGLNPDAPISTFVKRLRCSKCGSGSVMATRITQATAVQDQRKLRA
jgi:hypothetical protein